MYNPARIAVAGLVAWLFFWLVTPVYETAGLSVTAMLYIAFCYAGFFAGCMAYPLMTGVSERTVPANAWQGPPAYRLFWISTAIGVAGMALRIYDRIALRGADYGGSATDLRETLSQVSAGPVAAVAGVLFPFCLVPLLVLLGSRFKTRQIPLYIIAIAIFFVPTIESLAQLSRSILLTSIVLLFAAITCTKFRGNPASRKLLLATVGAIVIMSVASTAIFVSRLEETDRRLSDSVLGSVYAEHLQPTETAWAGLIAGSDLEKRYYSIILPNGMYYISGAYEFTELWLRPDGQDFAYGAYNFIGFVRAAQILLAPNAEPLDEPRLVYRTGTFQTFFGGAWVDFGYFAPLVMLVWGYFSRYLGLRARAGNLNVLPLYLLMVVIIFFMPVGNFVNGGLGNFIIGAFTLVAFFGPRKATEPGGQPPERASLPPPEADVGAASRQPG